MQYILQQEHESMIYQVFEATLNDPTKNDFVNSCKDYLACLKINLSFDEIRNLSKWKFKRLVKENSETAAFNYLISLKNTPGRDGRSSKVANIIYDALEIQQYLSENKNTRISKFIVKARAKSLDIKTHKSWKYEDRTCTGCKNREETGDEILLCEHFGKYEKSEKIPAYEWFFGDNVSEMMYCAEVMSKRLKIREKMLDNG